MADFKKPKNIFHIVEWVLAVLIAAVGADLMCWGCERHTIKKELIDATIFGYLIVSSLVFFGIFFSEETQEKTNYALNAMGGILYVLSGVLVLLDFENNDEHQNSDSLYYRHIVIIPLIFVLGVLYLVEFFCSLFKKSIFQ